MAATVTPWRWWLVFITLANAGSAVSSETVVGRTIGGLLSAAMALILVDEVHRERERA